ncbi:MAG TPA: PKD domain-containing protein [Planctomycetota bacterium]|nr:PKD domain-containing protein [Planctomycetota bacterium]
MRGKILSNGKGCPSFEVLEPRLLLDGAFEELAVELFDASPALFVENQGQWPDEAVRYSFHGPGMNVLFTDTGPVFQVFSQESSASPDDPDALGGPTYPQDETSAFDRTQFSVTFDGANVVSPIAMNPSAVVFNYFVGEEANWRTAVPTYSAVAYPNLYEGIDLYISGSPGGLKYEFRVDPGSNYSQIQLSYQGIDGLSLDAGGALHIQTALGELVDTAPSIYQTIDGQRVEVAGGFTLIDADTVTVSVAGEYDSSADLVIDPDLLWANYFGGSHFDMAIGTDAALSGDIVMAGMSSPIDSAVGGNADAFVAKYGTDGNLLWATFLGGTAFDQADGVATDNSGNVLLTGRTYSSNFGGATNGFHGVADAFAAKVSPQGVLDWALYLGGSSEDYGWGIAADSTGAALVAAHAWSEDFDGAGNMHHGGLSDAVAVKVSADGVPIWAKYLGGSSSEHGMGIAVDASDNVYLGIETVSDDFEGRINDYRGGWDTLAAKLNPNGELEWVTYVGGSLDDVCYGIAVDGMDDILLTGHTNSTDFSGAPAGGYHGGVDGFVAKVDPVGELQWATYLGGSAWDGGGAIDADEMGNIVVALQTRSSDFYGKANEYHGGFSDGMVAKVSPDGLLEWALYLGGAGMDSARGIAFDFSGNILTGGRTDSALFEGAINSPYGGTDAFLAKIGADNHAAMAQDDFYSVDEDATLNTAAPGVLANDFDPESDPLQAVPDAGPSHAQLFELQPDGSFTYVPDADFTGTDSFTYQAFDGELYSNTATVTITVNPVNDAPLAQAGPDQTTDEGTEIFFDGSASSDVEGDDLSHLWDFGDGETASGATATHTYADDGEYTVTLTVNDGNGGSSIDALTVTVDNVAPTVQILTEPQTLYQYEDMSLSARFTDVGIVDTHAASIAWGDGTITPGVVDPLEGTVTGGHHYTASGTFTVTVTVTDDDGGTSSATLTVTVLDTASAIDDLLGRIEGMELTNGVENSLEGKLAAVAQLLGQEVENDAPFEAIMDAFLRGVDHWYEKGKLTLDQHDELIFYGELIKLDLLD